MLPNSHTVILFSRTSFLHVPHLHIILLVSGYPKHLASSFEVAPSLNLANHSETCILPTFCSPKAIAELSVAFHPQFQAKSIADTLLCQVFHFPGICKSQMEEDMLVLNMTSLNSHMHCMDIQAGNDLAYYIVSAFRH